MQIDCINVTFVKARTGDQVIMRGEIYNKSGAYLNAVSLRVILYSETETVFRSLVVVRGIPAQTCRSFEVPIPDINFSGFRKIVTNHKVRVEDKY